MKSNLVKQITLKSLNALKRLIFDVNHFLTSLQTDIYNHLPKIEVISVYCFLFGFSYYKLEKRLAINKVSGQNFDFGPICNPIEKLSIKGCTHNNLCKLFDCGDYFRKENIFLNLKNLRELELRSNELEKLDPELFIGLENLYELKLFNNKFRHFDLRILNYLPRLKKISLSRRLISHNETEILKRFKESGIEFELNSV